VYDKEREKARNRAKYLKYKEKRMAENGTYMHQPPIAAEYRAWSGLRGRCRNPKDAGYMHYGGRGISVCERWDSYDAFLKDMGRRPRYGYSIDRIDNDGNYEPSNCRWATASQQVRNRRNHVMTPDRTRVARWHRDFADMSCAEISTLWGCDRTTIRYALNRSRNNGTI